MLTIQPREYALPDGRPLSIQFFRDLNHFQHVVNDHILHPLEPWERLLGVKFLNKARQKMKAGEVSVLEEVYDRVSPKLDEGIRFSISLPMYAEFEQERCRMGDTRWYKTSGYFFLSDQGLLMVIRDGVLRSVRLPKAGRGLTQINLSKRELFLAARKQVLESLRKSYYTDTKDNEQVRQIASTLIAPENWTGRPRI